MPVVSIVTVAKSNVPGSSVSVLPDKVEVALSNICLCPGGDRWGLFPKILRELENYSYTVGKGDGISCHYRKWKLENVIARGAGFSVTPAGSARSRPPLYSLLKFRPPFILRQSLSRLHGYSPAGNPSHRRAADQDAREQSQRPINGLGNDAHLPGGTSGIYEG
jgi:hypothetical protein